MTSPPETIPSQNLEILETTPDMVLAMLKLEWPQGPHLVSGYVRDLKFWEVDDKKLAFGRLELGTSSVKFRVPQEMAPNDNQPISMTGMFQLKKAPGNRGGFHLELEGSSVASWTPNTTAPSKELFESRESKTPLGSWLAQNQLSNLAIMCTENGEKDIVRALVDAGISERPQFHRANFKFSSKFISQLKLALSDPETVAIGLARGGGSDDELDLIGGNPGVLSVLLSGEKPFFSALGHEQNVLLVDKHSDQSFSTPTALGAQIAAITKDLHYRRQLRQSAAEKGEALSKAELQLSAARAKHKKMRRITLTLMTTIVALGALSAHLLGWLQP